MIIGVPSKKGHILIKTEMTVQQWQNASDANQDNGQWTKKQIRRINTCANCKGRRGSLGKYTHKRGKTDQS